MPDDQSATDSEFIPIQGALLLAGPLAPETEAIEWAWKTYHDELQNLSRLVLRIGGTHSLEVSRDGRELGKIQVTRREHPGPLGRHLKFTWVRAVSEQAG